MKVLKGASCIWSCKLTDGNANKPLGSVTSVQLFVPHLQMNGSHEDAQIPVTYDTHLTTGTTAPLVCYPLFRHAAARLRLIAQANDTAAPFDKITLRDARCYLA